MSEESPQLPVISVPSPDSEESPQSSVVPASSLEGDPLHPDGSGLTNYESTNPGGGSPGLSRDVPGGESATSGLLPMILMMMAVFILMNIFMGRSRRKQQKAESERLNALQKGDRVVTIGRMHGVITALTDDTVTIKPDDKASLTLVFDRNAVAKILPRPGEKDAGR